MFGSGGPVSCCALLTLFAVQLLQLPLAQDRGAVLLLWIGIQLLVDNDGDAEVHGHVSLLGAIRPSGGRPGDEPDNVIALPPPPTRRPRACACPLLVIGLVCRSR